METIQFRYTISEVAAVNNPGIYLFEVPPEYVLVLRHIGIRNQTTATCYFRFRGIKGAKTRELCTIYQSNVNQGVQTILYAIVMPNEFLHLSTTSVGSGDTYNVTISGELIATDKVYQRDLSR